MAELTGSLAQYQDIYDTIDAGAFSDMSDGSKSAFWNYISADRANQHELDMWNLQNAYNDPSAQMERMVKAGINPAAAYQQISSGNATSSPGTHKPNYAFNNQQQKMQQAEVIINGITSVLSSIGQVVNIAHGIQDIGLNYQNNYTNLLRYQLMRDGTGDILSSDPSYNNGHNIRIGDNMYIKPDYAVLFPELVGAGRLNSQFGSLDVNRNNSYWLNEIRAKNVSVERIMENLIESITNGASWQSILEDSLKLIFIKLFRGSY